MTAPAVAGARPGLLRRQRRKTTKKKKKTPLPSPTAAWSSVWARQVRPSTSRLRSREAPGHAPSGDRAARATAARAGVCSRRRLRARRERRQWRRARWAPLAPPSPPLLLLSSLGPPALHFLRSSRAAMVAAMALLFTLGRRSTRCVLLPPLRACRRLREVARRGLQRRRRQQHQPPSPTPTSPAAASSASTLCRPPISCQEEKRSCCIARAEETPPSATVRAPSNGPPCAAATFATCAGGLSATCLLCRLIFWRRNEWLRAWRRGIDRL